ncbi:MAG TPA: O-antigen ligase family protein [Ktedonobacterales bacterium]|jgi:O-antigen ligase|nr:O-antigen ligase family protein [Ktedonobacterales bacterium]
MSPSASKVVIAQRAGSVDGVARLLLYVAPLAVAFGSLAPIGVGSLRAGPTDAVVAALVALGLIALRRSPDSRALLADPINWMRGLWRAQPQALALLAALLAYLAVIVLTIVVAISRAPVIKETLKWSEVVAIVATTWLFIRTERQALWLAWSAIFAGVAEALLGCAQYVLATGLFGPGGANIRVFGTFDQPNPYGGYLNLSLPIALALTLFGRDPRMRWVAGGASVLMLFALYLSGSRGALLGLLAALIVLGAVGWRIERKALIALLIGAPLVLIAWFTHIVPASIENKLLAQFRVNDVSLNAQLNDANYSTIERLAHWIAGLRMFQAHPLLGVGAGNYAAAYQRFKVPGWDESLTHAHNYYINAAAETGALGLLAFLAVICVAMWVAWRATRATDTRRAARGTLAGVDARAIAIGCAAVIVALCVHNMTDDLFVHAMELQFALALGLLLRLGAPKGQQTDIR